MNKQMEKHHQEKYLQSCIGYSRYCSSERHHSIVKEITEIVLLFNIVLLKDKDTGGTVFS